jgi:hypothetical protein
VIVGGLNLNTFEDDVPTSISKSLLVTSAHDVPIG